MAVFRVIPAGDLALTPDETQLQIIEGVAAVRQKLASRFRMFLGEWFLDQRQGVPYYRDILIKNPNLGVIRSVFRKVILTTPGVLGITAFTLALDRLNRILSFDFICQATDGPIIVSSDDRDFIVNVGS
jgi:hypothetical protein